MKKTRKQRREEAVLRVEAYKYESSKNKRLGISENVWEENRQSHLNYLRGLK